MRGKIIITTVLLISLGVFIYSANVDVFAQECTAGESCPQIGGTTPPPATECPIAGQVKCAGECVNPAPPCTIANRAYDECSDDGCGDCTSNSQDCNGVCKLVANADCVAPKVWDACSETCSSFVKLYSSAVSSADTGFINVTGDIRSAKDLYLGTEKSIRVDGVGTTTLNIGNYWGAGATVELNVQGNVRGNFLPSAGSACADGRILKRSGATWICAVDETGTGGITTELDPKVGTLTANYLPKWSTATTSLVNSIINDTGSKVGIGTSTPLNLFHVNGRAQLNDVLIGEKGGGFNLIQPMNGGLRVSITGTPGLVISTANKVGIDTLTPTEALDIVGNLRTSGNMIQQKDDATGAALVVINQNNIAKLWTGMRLERQGIEKWFIGMNTTDDKLLFRFGRAADKLTIDGTTGNIILANNATVDGVNLDNVISTPTPCTTNQVLKRNPEGTAWICAADATGAGGVIPHGSLSGLTTGSDHTQYYLQTGDLRALTVGATLTVANNLIANGALNTFSGQTVFNSLVSINNNANIASGKRFLINSTDTAGGILEMGNFGGSDFHLKLSASAGKLSDIIFLQGQGTNNNRWSVSTRGDSSNFEIWRSDGTNWTDPVLSVDYTTGDITLAHNIKLSLDGATVDEVDLDNVITGLNAGSGILISETDHERTIGINSNVITTPTPCNTGTVLTRNGAAWECTAAAGGIIVETDPQVGTIAANYLPKWDSVTSALVTSAVYDNGTNVGIGTLNPTQKLDVNGSIKISRDLYLSSNKSLRVDGPGTTRLYIGNYKERDILEDANGVDVGIFGNLAVGTITIPRNLTVFGDIKGNFVSSTGASCTATGQVLTWNNTARTWGCAVPAGDAHSQYYLQTGDTRALSVGGRLDIKDDLVMQKDDATGTALLILNQNNIAKLWTGMRLERVGLEKWFIGMNEDDDKLSFRFGGTADKLTIDGTTGNIVLAANATVDGVNLDNVVSTPTPCASGTVLTRSGTTWTCSPVSAGGCTEFVYDHLTDNSYQGKYGSGGYAIVNGLCGTNFHVCTSDELLKSINCGVALSSRLPNTGIAWVSGGIPGYTYPAVNDCGGWNEIEGAFGAYWNFGTKRGLATTCDQSMQFACCK